jgi:Domain of Unknown Function (DUF928)
MKTIIASLVLLCLNLGFPRFSMAAEAASSAKQIEGAAEPTEPTIPVYKPRKESVPRARLGGRIRGEGDDPEVAALVPDHVAFTAKRKPFLYWYLSKPTSLPIKFTLNDSRFIRPVINTSVPSPSKPGIYRIQLENYGLALETDVQYMWAVSVIRDPESPSQDIASGGIIEAVEYPEACILGPCMCTKDDVYRYATDGFWYDSISCISELIEASPKDQALRGLRSGLLQQVGLHEVAKWDLKQNGSP